MTTRDIHIGAVSHTFPASPDSFRADCTGLFANPLSAQLARLLFLQGASLIHMVRWQSGYCSGLQPRVPPVRVRNASPFIPAMLDSFRADSQGLYATSLSESLARPSFTVRTKEPADVFPRRARLGPSCDIPDFASAPVGVARRILV